MTSPRSSIRAELAWSPEPLASFCSSGPPRRQHATIDDNATFTVGSGPHIPTLASTTLRIGHDADIFGTGATFLDGSIDWVMAGLGTLTAADRSYLAGRDATDPYPGDLTRQSRPSLVWTCAATDSANVPDNDHSALDGYAPAVQRVGENWTKVANGMLTWSVPQARAVSLLGTRGGCGHYRLAGRFAHGRTE